MHPATIPLAALTTFAAVFWFTPAPVLDPAAEPARIVAVEAPSGGGEALHASQVPAARQAKAPSRGAAGPRAVALDSPADPPVRQERGAAVYFSGCNEVRAAGLAPLYEGQPGYRPEMDGDDDGIACEPHRGRR